MYVYIYIYIYIHIYIYISETESLCYTPETNAIFLKKGNAYKCIITEMHHKGQLSPPSSYPLSQKSFVQPIDFILKPFGIRQLRATAPYISWVPAATLDSWSLPATPGCSAGDDIKVRVEGR